MPVESGFRAQDPHNKLISAVKRKGRFTGLKVSSGLFFGAPAVLSFPCTIELGGHKVESVKSPASTSSTVGQPG